MTSPLHNAQQFVTVTVADQLFGIPVLQVHDVLQGQHVNRIPLAPPEVAGSLNLRGRIVTAIDMRKKLSLPPRRQPENTEEEIPPMSIVVEHQQEMYSLVVDEVGDVLTLDGSYCEKIPSTLDSRWRNISQGVFQLDGKLMLVLDTAKFFDFSHTLSSETIQ